MPRGIGAPGAHTISWLLSILIDDVFQLTRINPWFLSKLYHVHALRKLVATHKVGTLPASLATKAAAPSRRGEVLGRLDAAGSACRVIAPAITGLLIDAAGLQAASADPSLARYAAALSGGSERAGASRAVLPRHAGGGCMARDPPVGRCWSLVRPRARPEPEFRTYIHTSVHSSRVHDI